MQVVKTRLRCPEGGIVEVSVLFDGGNGRSFITSSVLESCSCESLGKNGSLFLDLVGLEQGLAQKRKIFSLEIGGLPLELTEFPTMCADMFRAPVAKHIANTFKVDFTEDLSVGRPVKIDILIGLGYYWRLVTSYMKLVVPLV